MQRTASDGGIIISCDYCGTDWDPYDIANPLPMSEGHQGSVICLSCVKLALEQMSAAESPFKCALCLMEHPAGTMRWCHPSPNRQAEGLNHDGHACGDCIKQAAGIFSKDPDVPWRWERRGYSPDA